jgi:hypothetical protein
VYYDRDVTFDRDFPYSKTFTEAKRADFLELFKPAPVETFDTATLTAGVITSTILTSIGNVTFSRVLGSALSFSSTTPYPQSVRCPQSVDIMIIQFSSPVIAAGFTVYDVGTAGDYVLSASLNEQTVTNFIIPHTAPTDGTTLNDSLFYVGVVELSGFNMLQFIKGTRDTAFIDNFNAFISSDLL